MTQRFAFLARWSNGSSGSAASAGNAAGSGDATSAGDAASAGDTVGHNGLASATEAVRRAAGAPRALEPARGTVEPPPELESETQDIELIVAVFRTVVLLVALFVPSLFYSSGSYNVQMIWLAAIASVYNVAIGFAFLSPGPLGLRRPFIVAMDMLLITLWIQLSGQWELFPLYYVVVVVAAMWFRVFGGIVAALLCNFFFLLLWARAAGDADVAQPLAFSTTFALNVALLLLIACLVGSVAEAQERERTRRLEGQMLVANYQREIDLATQMQPLLVPSHWVSTGEQGSPVTTLRFVYHEQDGNGASTQEMDARDAPPHEAAALRAGAAEWPAALAVETPTGELPLLGVPLADAPETLRSGEVLNRELGRSDLVDVRPLPPMLDRTLQMGAATRPARAFGGGDYFDIIPLSGGRTALCIADVSGKSVRAQARLPLLKYSLRALAPLYHEPDALVKRLNETLAPDLQSELFIGLCYVVLDPQRGRLKWCNAGHIAPLLIPYREPAQSDKEPVLPSIIPLETDGPALGPFPEIGYTEQSLPWHPGDRLLMFTDGLSDALSYGGSEDGEDQIRLTALAINREYWDEPDGIAQRFVNLASAALEYTDSRLLNIAALRRTDEPYDGPGSGRRDDITVVVARYVAAPPA